MGVSVAGTGLYDGYPSTAAAARAARESGYLVDTSLLQMRQQPNAAHAEVHGDAGMAAAANDVNAAAASTSGADGADEQHECPVCLDDISVDDSAMRCAGEGGIEHYFHARCLSKWTKTQRAQSDHPTCPICRG